MKPTTFLFTAATLLLTASAVPFHAELPDTHHEVNRDATADPSAVAILLKIAPSASSCDNAPAAGQCATAAQAAMPIINSFAQYGVSTPPEQAALLSLMAFESGEFKYNKNLNTVGQGCRNMQMPNFNREYAAVVPGADASISDSAALLTSIIQAGGEWGAAAWFYNTKCSDAVKNGLKTGGKAGWEGYITGCVGTTVTDQRTQYWQRAAQALGMSTN